MPKILLLLTIFILSFNGLSGQTPPFPLTKCWEFKSDLLLFDKIASDNNNSIILPLNNSEIITLDKTGKTIWNSEIGGNLISNITSNKDKIFYALQKENQPNSFIIRSLSIETGLTIWEKSIGIDKNVEKINIVNNNKELIIIVENSYLFLLNFINGETIRSNKIEATSTSSIEMFNNNLYLVNNKNELIEYSLKDNTKRLIFQLKEAVSQIFVSKNGRIFIVNILGQITQINPVTLKKDWIVRVGANVNSVTEYEENYLIPSIDNYVYYVSSKNGRFIWRKRADGRIDGLLIKEPLQYALTVINGQTTIFLELSKGRTINQIILPEGAFFTRKPFLLGKLLILSLNDRISAYSFAKC